MDRITAAICRLTRKLGTTTATRATRLSPGPDPVEYCIRIGSIDHLGATLGRNGAVPQRATEGLLAQDAPEESEIDWLRQLSCQARRLEPVPLR
jgi:hypothetical protein